VKVILGIGNPGPEYALTRHNVGWWVVDHLAETWGATSWKRDGGALVASGVLGTTRVRLIKPQTYVNLSGSVLRPYLRRAQWSAASDLLVVADDVALPLGGFRLRASGSSGGHNGLRSIEAAVGSREYPRLRVGIRPVEPHRGIGALADFVLDATSKAERATLLSLLPALTDAADCFVREGITAAMNAFNRRGSSC
jgi:PTH1 family peptidyl-tRNA hydrolase